MLPWWYGKDNVKILIDQMERLKSAGRNTASRNDSRDERIAWWQDTLSGYR